MSAFPAATEAGLQMLASGGNAMDAAVAVAWALSVCEPSASGLGGHTVMLARFADRRTAVIDGSSYAPAAASRASISMAEQQRGHRACTIPGTPAALDAGHAKYGRLTREQVMAPAIRIAADGYEVTVLQRRQTRWVVEALAASRGGRLFLADGLVAPLVGERMRQPQLARTLLSLSACGAELFYRGGMAQQIAADMVECGGLMTMEDLARCVLPVESQPISASYRGYRVLSVAPPSGGLELLIALKVLSQILDPDVEPYTAAWYEAIALTTSSVFGERERRARTEASAGTAMLEGLLDESYARQVASRLAFVSDDDTEEPGETTHLVAADTDGNVVLLTQSIQSLFGAKVAHPELGFLYNNYLCTCPRQDHAYALRPGCRARSNIAPTLVLARDGAMERPVLALGAAGSRRIVSAQLQVLSAVIDGGHDIVKAVAAPRVHGLAGRKVWIEQAAASDELIGRLNARGRRSVVKNDLDFTMGAVNALQFLSDGRVEGAADPRRDGNVRTFQ